MEFQPARPSIRKCSPEGGSKATLRALRMSDPQPAPTTPQGEVVIRTIAMPADTNANGDIFGGWLMSQMDLGGAVLAKGTSRSRVVTVSVETMNFVAPVNVGDLVTCYARILSIGRTSLKIQVDVWVQRFLEKAEIRVTHGIFTYVAIDEQGKPTPVNRT